MIYYNHKFPNYIFSCSSDQEEYLEQHGTYRTAGTSECACPSAVFPDHCHEAESGWWHKHSVNYKLESKCRWEVAEIGWNITIRIWHGWVTQQDKFPHSPSKNFATLQAVKYCFITVCTYILPQFPPADADVGTNRWILLSPPTYRPLLFICLSL